MTTAVLIETQVHELVEGAALGICEGFTIDEAVLAIKR